MGIESTILKGMANVVKGISPPLKNPDAETLSAALAGKTYCDREVKKQVLDLDGKWNDCRLVLEGSGYAAAKIAYLEHQKAQQQMLVEGNFKGDFFTLQDWVEEMAERGMAARRLMMLLSQQAAVLCRPICARVSSILNEQADEIEQADRAQYEKFAVQVVPHPLAARLRELAAITMRRVSGGGGSRPSHYCVI